MWWYDYIIEKALMKNSSLIENARITYKTIIIFAVMGIISGSLMIVIPNQAFLADYPIMQEVYKRLIPGLVFGTILYITLNRYQLTKGNHWINLTVLILITAVGWYLAIKMVNSTGGYGASTKGIVMAGLTGALCVSVSLLWVCGIHKDKNNRATFVWFVGFFGMIGAVIYTMIDPSNRQINIVFPIWQSMVFMSIPFSFFYCRWLDKNTNTRATKRVKKRVIEIKNQAVKAVERGEPFKKK